jgi:hypothetical protein
MDVLERYALSGNRPLVLSLSDFLLKCKSESMPVDVALAAVCHLASAIESRYSEPAWYCLACLCSKGTNSQMEPLLDALQDRQECGLILQRCVTCLTNESTPLISRENCLAFLLSFAEFAPKRAVLVMDMSGLAKAIVSNAHTELTQSPGSYLGFVAIEALSHLSFAMARPIDHHDFGAAGQKYCEAFLELDAHRVLILALPTLTECSGQEWKNECYHAYSIAMSKVWQWLTTAWGIDIIRHNRAKFWLTSSEQQCVAKSMLELLNQESDNQVPHVLNLTYNYLLTVDALESEAGLFPCLTVSAQPEWKYLDLLSALESTARRQGNEQCLSAILSAMLDWRTRYPSIAVYLSNRAAVQTIVAESAAPVARADTPEAAVAAAASAPAAANAPAASPTSAAHASAGDVRSTAGANAGAQKDRHCQYPDCTVSGTGTEYTWKCAVCCTAYYCSREHQKKHWWAAHKAVCREALP